MKIKKIRGKLSLNKETVVDLNEKAMKNAYGGATFVNCPTGWTYCRTDCVTNCPLCPSMDTKCPDCY